LALYGVEEFFVKLKFGEVMDSDLSDEALAEIVDSVADGEAAQIDRKDYQAVQSVVTALKKMEGDRLPLPDLLRRVTQSGVMQSVPSILIGLGSERMRLIKSSFRGLCFLPDATPALRSAASAQSSPMYLSEDVGGQKIEYRIQPEAGGRITLETIFPEKIGSCRITLKKEGRIVASSSVGPTKEAVDFSGIEQGIYEIEIVGAVNHSFRLYLVYE
jgi:hypothetical protein